MSKAVVLSTGNRFRFIFSMGLGAKFNMAFLVVLFIAGGNVLAFHRMLAKADGVAETINIAGKLRMLSQKIAFEATVARQDSSQNQLLGATIADYETALTALEHGGIAFGFQIQPAPVAMAELTSTLRNDWTQYRRYVESLIANASPASDALSTMSQLSTQQLRDAESLVDALTKEAKNAQYQALLLLYSLFLFETIVFGILVVRMRKRIVHPLLQLARSAREMAAGNYDNRIEFKSSDEVGELIETFNLASQQIGQLVSQLELDREGLRQAESMFRGLAENSIVGVYILKGDRFLFVNNILADMFNYERQELMESVGLFDLFVKEDRQLVEEKIRQRMDGEVDSVNYEVRGRRKDGSALDVEVFGSKMEIDGRTATIGVMLDISTRRAQQQQLEYVANHDALTGLANRNLLADRIRQAIALAKRGNSGVAVLLLDLDYFKVVNDSLGHGAGDTLLQAVAQRLQATVREGDTVARFGGDEFVVLMPGIDSAGDAGVVAAKIHTVLSSSFDILGQEVFVYASIGIALYPQDGEAEMLIKNADLAMYLAKQEGRNGFRFYSSEMDVRNSKRLTLERELHRALDNNDLEVAYQPKICLRTGCIVGAEALLRWHHVQLGNIQPREFIPVAEETGLIVPIGEWVMRTVCAQNRAWQLAGFNPITVAVNLSGKQFRDCKLVERIQQMLAATGLAAQYLELELTESILMEHMDESIAVITELKALGIRFAMDDFGTGYSSLNYLKRFPFDNLKLDQTFIHEMASAPRDEEIVKTVIALGRSLGLKTVAEGVETAEQLSLLVAHGCAEAQGYYFSAALPPERFEALLRAQHCYSLPH